MKVEDLLKGKKPDEIEFLRLVYTECTPYNPEFTIRDLINSKKCPCHYKRAWYLLKKWRGLDWYEYGVTLDLGWLTDKGIEIASLIAQEISKD